MTAGLAPPGAPPADKHGTSRDPPRKQNRKLSRCRTGVHMASPTPQLVRYHPSILMPDRPRSSSCPGPGGMNPTPPRMLPEVRYHPSILMPGPAAEASRERQAVPAQHRPRRSSDPVRSEVGTTCSSSLGCASDSGDLDVCRRSEHLAQFFARSGPGAASAGSKDGPARGGARGASDPRPEKQPSLVFLAEEPDHGISRSQHRSLRLRQGEPRGAARQLPGRRHRRGAEQSDPCLDVGDGAGGRGHPELPGVATRRLGAGLRLVRGLAPALAGRQPRRHRDGPADRGPAALPGGQVSLQAPAPAAGGRLPGPGLLPGAHL
ncbi:translation initiation factor IF-2-like isoform X3 [Synchiropus splendidus]|uniref:translation initiation factor IF-2-like isoform X3 n=1 Tax=Synchiropus splendidus TaxID=270530 RepID=UPI00237DEC0D|nr:translation initiation factor IF-2-like isoform X3 [Synchiropus splendidus]